LHEIEQNDFGVRSLAYGPAGSPDQVIPANDTIELNVASTLSIDISPHGPFRCPIAFKLDECLADHVMPIFGSLICRHRLG